MGIILKDSYFILPAVKRRYSLFDTLKGIHCSRESFSCHERVFIWRLCYYAGEVE
jgi:hypothetical protein